MPEKGTKEYLSTEEVRALLNAPYQTSVRDRMILRFLVSTGARVTEFVMVKLKDISLVPGEEMVRLRTLKQKVKTFREVPLDDPHLIQLLYQVIPDGYDPEVPLVDLSRQSITSIVKKYTKRAGLNKNTYSHMLRHTYAVSRLKAGLDLRTLQRLLGHRKLESTAEYLMLTLGDIRDEVKKCPLPW